MLVFEVRSWEEIDKNSSHGAMDILEDPWSAPGTLLEVRPWIVLSCSHRQCITLTNAHLNGMAATAFTGKT